MLTPSPFTATNFRTPEPCRYAWSNITHQPPWIDSSLLLKKGDLASIRKRNKFLIIPFLALIILLPLITGGAIISFLQQVNSKSLKSNPAIQEFCSPFQLRSACVDFLVSAIKPPPDANPNHIFLLSLESSPTKIISTARSEQTLGSCSILLSTQQHHRDIADRSGCGELRPAKHDGVDQESGGVCGVGGW